jgi:hypothetical protein
MPAIQHDAPALFARVDPSDNARIEEVRKRLNMTRSAFFRRAISEFLHRLEPNSPAMYLPDEAPRTVPLLPYRAQRFKNGDHDLSQPNPKLSQASQLSNQSVNEFQANMRNAMENNSIYQPIRRAAHLSRTSVDAPLVQPRRSR